MPAFDPTKWSGLEQFQNNCYDYAIDRPDNYSREPGALAKLDPIVPWTRDVLISHATADGLRPIGGPNDCHGQDCWPVALFLRPADSDYHWYRRDDDGTWSHKEGPDAVTNLDEDGAVIRDPMTCARPVYTEFVSYFCVCRSRLHAPQGPQ